MQPIEIKQGDITQAKVDAIVNAANPGMLGGGGVDGAIHRAAGPALLAACKAVPEVNGVRCPFGEARITAAGNLPAKYVIHTAGPIYHNEANPERVLQSSYEHCLQLAIEHKCRSIAFPAISCGVYGYPHQEAAHIALSTCCAPSFQSLAISFYLFSQDMLEIWQQAYEKIQHQ